MPGQVGLEGEELLPPAAVEVEQERLARALGVDAGLQVRDRHALHYSSDGLGRRVAWSGASEIADCGPRPAPGARNSTTVSPKRSTSPSRSGCGRWQLAVQVGAVARAVVHELPALRRSATCARGGARPPRPRAARRRCRSAARSLTPAARSSSTTCCPPAAVVEDDERALRSDGRVEHLGAASWRLPSLI